MTVDEFIKSGGRIPAHPILGPGADGSHDRPYNIVLHENVEPYLLEFGHHEGDIIQLNGPLGGWWRIVYSRYIPIAS